MKLGAALFLVVCSLELATASRSSIVIVPGRIGSQLESRVTSSESPCECCTDGWTGLWISLTRRFTKPECFLNELTLVYNSTTNNYSNASGVEVRVPGFGGTETVEYLDADMGSTMIPYWNVFVDYFVNCGYERGKTIRAAPYDWRLAADQLEQRGYYTQLQKLVEEMYEESGGQKVTLVVHSMGGVVTQYFLASVVNQEWKDRYINAFIPLCSDWAGSYGAIENVIFLNSDANPIFRGLNLTPVQRTQQSNYWLLPNSTVWDDRVLVITLTQNYTANDYESLLTDIGYEQGFEMYAGITTINAGFPAPNVPVYCFYGTGIDTTETLVYNSSFPDVAPVEGIVGNGDGVVNLRSAETCLMWRDDPEQTQPFISRAFSGVMHLAILQNTAVLEEIKTVVITDGATSVFAQLTMVVQFNVIALLCSLMN